MAINIGPFQQIVALNMGSVTAISIQGFYLVGVETPEAFPVDTKFYWGVGNKRLAEMDVTLDVDGPVPNLITVDNIREAMAAGDVEVPSTNKIKVFAGYDYTFGLYGAAFQFKSFDGDGALKAQTFQELPIPYVNNPVQLDLNNRTWTFPAPP